MPPLPFPIPKADSGQPPSFLIGKGSVLSEQDKFDEAIVCFDAALSMLSAREAAAQAERAEQGEGGPNGNSSGERGDRSTPPPGSPRGAGAGDPELVRALFGKGVALGKLGRNTQAGQVLEAVLVADAGHADAMVYLAMLRLRDSRVDEGIALCRLALERDAAHALGKEVLSTALTDEGTRLKVAGFSDLAFERYAEAAQVSPGCAPARYNLGIIHADRGEVEEALRAYRAALHVRPTYAEAHNNMGVVLKGAGRIAEAVEAYRACLRVDPNFELASKNLSIALSDLGTIVKGSDEPDARARALEHYQEALFHNSKNADAMYNLGVSYCERNELAKAAVCYELTLQINPRCAEAHNNLGVIHKDLGNLPKALQSYESALRLRPTFPEALNNLGVVYTMMCAPDDALAYFNAALQVQPSYSEAYINLGKFYQDTGDVEQAVELYSKCIAVCRVGGNAAHNRLLALNYSIARTCDEVSEQHLAWGRDAEAAAAPRGPYANSRDPARRLRVGYVSPDFNAHSVAYFAEVLLRDRDPASTHVTCFYAQRKEDSMTRRFRALADEWVDVALKSTAEVAALVRAREIDILVDLAGHTAGNRLDVFAAAPAPVQVAWIGYPNTSGLLRMDYRFTDARADPPATTQRFSEALVRLPHCFLCYTPPHDAPPVAPPPSDVLGYVAFGTFNNVAKINARVVRLWARVLLAVPESQLILKSRAFAAKDIKATCQLAFAKMGVDKARIDMRMVHVATRDHLASYAHMDIALDPFPYAGTTTTLEALHMGVPVVTLRAAPGAADANHAHNVGVSLLAQAGLSELVAESEEAYLSIAVALAKDPARLRALRETLRERLQASPLCDGTRFMRDVEAAYRRMWHAHCQAPAPAARDAASPPALPPAHSEPACDTAAATV